MRVRRGTRRRRRADARAAATRLERAYVEQISTEAGVVALSGAVSEPRHGAIVFAKAYHHISQEFRRTTGIASLDWCAYAKWSSRQVSQMLDIQPDAPFITAPLLRLPRWLRRPFASLFLQLLGRGEYESGLQVANRQIFAEMALLHVRLIEHYRRSGPAGAGPDPDVVLAGIEPTPDEDVRLFDPDPDLLAEAIRWYGRAATADDPSRAAEYTFAANSCLSAYEQFRVQGALAAVLRRPVRWLLIVSWRAPLTLPLNWIRGRGWTPLERGPIYRRDHADQPPFVRAVERRWLRLMTKFVLVLSTPVASIRLGRPLSVPEATRERFTAGLGQLRDEEVRRVAARFRVPPEFPSDVRSRDWSDYDDRMRFIVEYFRVFAPVEEMDEDPFRTLHWRYQDRQVADARRRIIELLDPAGRAVGGDGAVTARAEGRSQASGG